MAEENNQENEKKSPIKLILMIVGGIVLLGGGIGVGMFVGGGDDTDPSTEISKIIEKKENPKESDQENQEKEEELEKERKQLGVEDSLKSLEILDLETLVILGKNNIKTKDDLADLSSDELLEIVGDRVQDLEEANKIIMKAREDWFNEID